jgi:hypothetical protein
VHSAATGRSPMRSGRQQGRISPHRAPPGSTGELGWAGCGPGLVQQLGPWAAGIGGRWPRPAPGLPDLHLLLLPRTGGWRPELRPRVFSRERRLCGVRCTCKSAAAAAPKNGQRAPKTQAQQATSQDQPPTAPIAHSLFAFAFYFLFFIWFICEARPPGPGLGLWMWKAEVQVPMHTSLSDLHKFTQVDTSWGHSSHFLSTPQFNNTDLSLLIRRSFVLET